MTFRLNAAGFTHIGRVRRQNEDALFMAADHGLFAVADGMGGLEFGAWASAQIIEQLAAAVHAEGFDRRIEAITAAAHRANAKIYLRSNEQGLQIGSTLAMLQIERDRFAVLWAGDSRVYVLRRGALVQLTRDHTHVRELLEQGLLSPDEVATHPMKHILARAVGVQKSLQLDAVSDDIKGGDVFLLCSDGLTGLVSEGEITATLADAAPERAAQALINLALVRGGLDNVTVIVVVCEETSCVTIAEPASETMQ